MSLDDRPGSVLVTDHRSGERLVRSETPGRSLLVTTSAAEITNSQSVRRSIVVPLHVAKCRRCGSRLRLAHVPRINELFVVCDTCERAAFAPRALIEFFLEETNQCR